MLFFQILRYNTKLRHDWINHHAGACFCYASKGRIERIRAIPSIWKRQGSQPRLRYWLQSWPDRRLPFYAARLLGISEQGVGNRNDEANAAAFPDAAQIAGERFNHREIRQVGTEDIFADNRLASVGTDRVDRFRKRFASAIRESSLHLAFPAL